MTDPDFNPSAILEAITPTVRVGRKEYVAGRICFGMMFLIPPDGRFSAPPRMVQAAERVFQDFPLEYYDCWSFENPWRQGLIAQQPPPDLQRELERFMSENDSHYTGAFGAEFRTGDLKGKTPPTQMLAWFYNRVLERDSHKDLDESNTFRVNIPLRVLDRLSRPQLTQKLFTDLCAILQPLSAVGGLCMATSPDPVLLQNMPQQQSLYPIMLNSPGLLFGDSFGMANRTRWRMSAVNWLTAVRGDLLELCGGRDSVRAQLTRPEIETAPYGEAGLIIQAGPSPQLGNLEAGLTLPDYGAVARALRPARLRIDGERPAHLQYFGPDDDHSDEKMSRTQNAWLARFDDMN